MALQLPLIESPAPESPVPESPGSAVRPVARPRPRAFATTPGRSGVLVEIPAADWRIDPHTKEVGLAGVAAARRALAEAVGRGAGSDRRRTAA